MSSAYRMANGVWYLHVAVSIGSARLQGGCGRVGNEPMQDTILRTTHTALRSGKHVQSTVLHEEGNRSLVREKGARLESRSYKSAAPVGQAWVNMHRGSARCLIVVPIRVVLVRVLAVQLQRRPRAPMTDAGRDHAAVFGGTAGVTAGAGRQSRTRH